MLTKCKQFREELFKIKPGSKKVKMEDFSEIEKKYPYQWKKFKKQAEKDKRKKNAN
jgi:hypothetical protein